MTWVIVVLNLLFLVMLISAAGSTECETEEFVEACEAGTAIGVGVVVFFWAAVDVILGVIWLVTRPNKRQCPACGRDVAVGLTVCPSCQHNFRVQPA